MGVDHTGIILVGIDLNEFMKNVFPKLNETQKEMWNEEHIVPTDFGDMYKYGGEYSEPIIGIGFYSAHDDCGPREIEITNDTVSSINTIKKGFKDCFDVDAKLMIYCYAW